MKHGIWGMSMTCIGNLTVKDYREASGSCPEEAAFTITGTVIPHMADTTLLSFMHVDCIDADGTHEKTLGIYLFAAGITYHLKNVETDAYTAMKKLCRDL